MSRHGYTDDAENFAMWRGRVASAIRGKRGQKMLRELRDALDAMPEKRLVARQLQTAAGECCTLGCLARSKGVDLSEVIDADDDVLHEFGAELADRLDVAECLIQEIEYWNDECGERAVTTGPGAWHWVHETPEERWTRMRAWVEKHIKPAPQNNDGVPASAGA